MIQRKQYSLYGRQRGSKSKCRRLSSFPGYIHISFLHVPIVCAFKTQADALAAYRNRCLSREEYLSLSLVPLKREIESRKREKQWTRIYGNSGVKFQSRLYPVISTYVLYSQTASIDKASGFFVDMNTRDEYNQEQSVVRDTKSSLHSLKRETSMGRRDTTLLHLVRGPLLFGTLVIAWVAPYVAAIPISVILQCFVFVFGLLLFCYDTLRFVESKSRMALRTLLNSMVLDDVLRAIHDPETGLIPCIVGSFVGASSMYALNMTDNQKTKLVQSSLWTTESQARTILLNPGGTISLLPESMQTWLKEGDQLGENSKSNQLDQDYRDEGESDASDSVCPADRDEVASLVFEESEVRARSLPSFDGENDSGPNISQEFKGDTEGSNPGNPYTVPPDPLKVMLSIMGEMARDQLRPIVRSIPEAALETAGGIASLGLLMQLLLRRRSKTSVPGALCALGLSGVAGGALSVLLARHFALGNIRCSKTFKQTGSTIAKQVVARMKGSLAANGRWKATIAMLVLVLIGRRKSGKITWNLGRES